MEPLVVAGVVLGFGIILYLLFGEASVSNRPPAPDTQIDAFAVAIAKQENSPSGWNNPGDLTQSFGFPTTGPKNADGVLGFASSDDGWNALYAQLQLIRSGGSIHKLTDTLDAFGASYSNGDPSWASNVAGFLGVGTDATLGDLLT